VIQIIKILELFQPQDLYQLAQICKPKQIEVKKLTSVL